MVKRKRTLIGLPLLLVALTLPGCDEAVAPRSEQLIRPSLDEVAVEEDIEGSSFAEGLAALSPTDMSTAAATSAAGPSRQGAVVPAAYTWMMGNFNNRFPHATHNMRYQQVFLGSELGGLRTVEALCLRRDEFAGGPAQTQRLAIRLGPTQMNHINLGRVFDANYSAPPTDVFSGDVALPASSGGGFPEDFYLCIDFTRAYRHPDGSNVIVEVVNTSATSVGHFEDACNRVATAPECTTRRVFAMSATATVATSAVNSGLIMKLVGKTAATTTTTNQIIPFDQVLSGCTEPIAFTGSLHLVTTETRSASGNLHVMTHAQPQGVSGTGLITGATYQGTGVTQQSLSINAPLPYTESFINNFRLIGQGPDNNRLVHENFHVTVNANGEVTTVHDNFMVDCK